MTSIVSRVSRTSCPSSSLTSQGKSILKHFDISSFPSIKCRVHPVVIFTILDGYIRREEDQQYVIGSLMGVMSEGNLLEITDCFVDRHSLTDEGLLQIIKDHHESMYELKQRINPKEQVVGWFCTGSEMSELTCAVHGWFKQFSNVSKFVPSPPLTDPIHLMVDTTLEKHSLSIKAYLQAPLSLVKESCFHFQEIPLEVFSPHADKGGISMLLKALEISKKSGGREHEAIANYKDGFEFSLEKLLELLLKCDEYVMQVIQNDASSNSSTQSSFSPLNRKYNATVGRYLSRALCVDAAMEPSMFEQICQNSLQDNLMVAYLANLAQLQFALAEKLNTSFF